MRFIAIAFALIPLTVSALELSKEQRAAIEARIQPYSQVCVVGDDACAVGDAIAEVGDLSSGEDVYNSACLACHSTGAAGAPKVGAGNAAACKSRMEKGM